MSTPDLSPTATFVPGLLKGKVVLITGGGTGIGLGIARSMGLLGARIAISGRRKHKLDEAVADLTSCGIEAVGFSSDVRDYGKCEDFVASVLKHFGTSKIDILVNNAAGNFMSSVEHLTPNGFRTVMEIDVFGCFHMAKACFEGLKASGSGLIICISAALHYRALPYQAHASAAKAAIDKFFNVVGVEWGEYGIRSVTVAPGPIAGTVGGPTGRVFGSSGKTGKGGISNVALAVPVGRVGEVEDVANAAIFLASPGGSFINATQIVVDGGNWHGTVGDYLKAKPFVEAKQKAELEAHRKSKM